MIDLDFLQALIRTVDETGIDSVEISRGGTRVRISKSPPVISGGVQSSPVAAMPPAQGQGPAPAPQAEGTAVSGSEAESREERKNGWAEVESPMVGTFYRAPAPEAPSYVEVGTRVSKGQTLCILEAMKLMNELESEVDGVVREICVKNAEPVEYGQVLFRIEPD